MLRSFHIKTLFFFSVRNLHFCRKVLKVDFIWFTLCRTWKLQIPATIQSKCYTFHQIYKMLYLRFCICLASVYLCKCIWVCNAGATQHFIIWFVKSSNKVYKYFMKENIWGWMAEKWNTKNILMLVMMGKFVSFFSAF